MINLQIVHLLFWSYCMAKIIDICKKKPTSKCLESAKHKESFDFVVLYNTLIVFN